MKYRLNKNDLITTLASWDGFLSRKVHLIACGGTAMTLLGVKESTKDVDFIVPEPDEHQYIIKVLTQLGYADTESGLKRQGEVYVFQFFKGQRVHTTDLLSSPLEKGNHVLVKEFAHLYVGALNFYDLIISKIFRCTSVDVEDCLALVKARRQEIDLKVLADRFRETALYDITQDKMMKNWEHFARVLRKEGLDG